MLLAADVGGTKTLVGLFEPGDGRPGPTVTRVYATSEFSSLAEIVRAFMAEVGTQAVDAIAAGVAGPVSADVARLTNADVTVDRRALSEAVGGSPAVLLNDLAAMAWAVPALRPDELHALHAPDEVVSGNMALIAAGTGLGQAVLQRLDGRLVPTPSEGGHADFAARTPRELELVAGLARAHGRVEVEGVLSGSGIVNLFRFTHHSDRGDAPCEAIADTVPEDDLPAAVSESALAGACPRCVEALDMFVAAYGAEAGNLALRAMATSGIYIGGGIAPKILPALTKGGFMKAFLDKAPMHTVVARIPVHVILNADAVLIGAAIRAARLAAEGSAA